MKRNMICAFTLLVLGLSAVARSDDDFDEDESGPLSATWSGVIGNDDDGGHVALELSTVRNRVYRGRISFSSFPGGPVVPPDPIVPPDPVRLVNAASGRISLTGRTNNWALEAHGVADGGMLLLNYHINFRNGSHGRGQLVLWRVD